MTLIAERGKRRREARRSMRLRRLRIASEAIPRPPPARSLPRHLPPARCFAQALWFDLQHLGLPTDELALKLSEFLWLAHANHPLGKVERVEERFFGQEHGALANDRRLLIHAFGRLAGDHEHALESGLALAQILFGDFAHPIHAVGCRLHRSFGILLSEIRCTFGHSFRLLQSWSGLELV